MLKTVEEWGQPHSQGLSPLAGRREALGMRLGWGGDNHQDKFEIAEFKAGAESISMDKSYCHHDTDIQATVLININQNCHSYIRHLLVSAVNS